MAVPALHIEALTHRYPDGTTALAGVDLSVGPGERVALLGPNGAGKSTLMLHINGVIMPQSGTVTVDGVVLGADTLRRVRESVGLVFQDPDDQLFMTTVYDDVAFGPLNMGLAPDEVDRRVHAALHDVSLPEMASKSGMRLSFGEKKRIALATVLSMRPKLLVLDEPSSNLDPRSRRGMIELLAGVDATMLVATHDLDLAARLCQRAVVLDAGLVVADGPVADVLWDERLMLAHGLEVPAASPRTG